jgi:hypothetical protein
VVYNSSNIPPLSHSVSMVCVCTQKRDDFFSFSKQPGDKYLPHFVSRRWLRLLNTDNMPLHVPQNGIEVILLHFENVIPTAPHNSQNDSNENPTAPHESWQHGLGLAGHFISLEVESLRNHRDSMPNLRGCGGARGPEQLCSTQGNYCPVKVEETHGHPRPCSQFKPLEIGARCAQHRLSNKT